MIGIPDFTTDETVDLGGYGVLQVGDTLYLPFRALSGENSFGWSVFYDDYSGLYVSTDNTVAANLFFDATESDYNRGLAAYITSRNSAISKAKALKLVFIIQT